MRKYLLVGAILIASVNIEDNIDQRNRQITFAIKETQNSLQVRSIAHLNIPESVKSS